MDKAGDYVVPNLLSPRDLVSRPDNMDETVPHTRIIHKKKNNLFQEFIREGCLQKFSRKGYQQRMFFLVSSLLVLSSYIFGQPLTL